MGCAGLGRVRATINAGHGFEVSARRWRAFWRSKKPSRKAVERLPCWKNWSLRMSVKNARLVRDSAHFVFRKRPFQAMDGRLAIAPAQATSLANNGS